jgi:transcriptional regulator of arginine metabolism
MKNLSARREKIRKLIENGRFDSQEKLLEALKKEGFAATQSTLSRDFKEMGIIREGGEDGFFYKFRQSSRSKPNIFLSSIKSLVAAGSIVVISCESGTAGAVCTLIDKLAIKNVAGTIAGDDTIFAACDSEKGAKYAAAEIKKYAGL